jgi:hypothetical protein
MQEGSCVNKSTILFLVVTVVVTAGWLMLAMIRSLITLLEETESFEL